MCKDSRIWLDQHKDCLRYTASVTFKPFKGHVRKVEALFLAGPAGDGVGGDKVRKPGDWVGMFNPNTSEMFIYAWDEIKAIGHKYNLGNCMVKRARVNTHDNELRHIKGAYDIYKYCFNLCDVYNRALHDRKWPFKPGGNGVAGEWGHMDKWAMSACLLNTFNCWRDVTDDEGGYIFQDFCLRLADELYHAALTMPTYSN
jgi:hypothetical protein